MHPHLDSKLCEQFPLLYADRRKDPHKTCMIWGFECGDGWYQLLYDLSSKLEPLIAQWREENRNTGDPEDRDADGYYIYHPRASQVKEKYGTLRFYMSSGTDAMYALVNATEDRSGEICEVCGQPGSVRGHGWLTCLCDECHNIKQNT